jgi:ribosomal protein L27
MGVNVGKGRQSHNVAKVDGDVLMSAKKRTRRSEYVRRRSRMDGDKMDVKG